jgi:hypothetical protein
MRERCPTGWAVETRTPLREAGRSLSEAKREGPLPSSPTSGPSPRRRRVRRGRILSASRRTCAPLFRRARGRGRGRGGERRDDVRRARSRERDTNQPLSCSSSSAVRRGSAGAQAAPRPFVCVSTRTRFPSPRLQKSSAPAETTSPRRRAGPQGGRIALQGGRSVLQGGRMRSRRADPTELEPGSRGSGGSRSPGSVGINRLDAPLPHPAWPNGVERRGPGAARAGRRSNLPGALHPLPPPPASGRRGARLAGRRKYARGEGLSLSLFARSSVAAKVPLAVREGFLLPLVSDEEDHAWLLTPRTKPCGDEDNSCRGLAAPTQTARRIG